MELQALTVCINYADFLEEAIKHNLQHFSRWLIVTSPDDHDTRNLCRRNGLQCLLTEEHKKDGGFSKGHLIERGLQHLGNNGWRVHIDADIVLPHKFSQWIETTHLDEDCIYGLDRIMVRSHEDWVKLQSMGYLDNQHAFHCLVNFPEGYRVGSRWAMAQTGWVPIGFFQLWHAKSEYWSGIRSRPYPSQHTDCTRTDVQQSLQWDRRKRILIPEIIAIHLESEACPTGTNWKGRKTKRFGPEKNTSFSQLVS